MPKGMLESEKSLSGGIDSHDLRGAILVVRGRMVVVISTCRFLGEGFGMGPENVLSIGE